MIGLFKAEVIRRWGPWRGLEDVEFATLVFFPMRGYYFPHLGIDGFFLRMGFPVFLVWFVWLDDCICFFAKIFRSLN